MEGETLKQETACQAQMFLDVTEVVYTDFAILAQLRKC